jgi:hypothetical protein
MQIVKTSPFPGTKVIFESILDEIPGGVGLNVERLDNLTVNANVDKRFLPAGTPVYVDLATRIAEVCKSATALAGSSAQAIRIAKNNHYKAGDLINDGVTSSTISSITSSGATYDVLNTAEALVYAEGTKYGEGSASGTSAALLYTPNGMTKDTAWIFDGNADVAVVTMGTVRADALTFPVNALYAVALRGGTAGTGKSLITLV